MTGPFKAAVPILCTWMAIAALLTPGRGAPALWPQFGYDAAHSGATAGMGPQGPTVKTVWTFSANDAFSASPLLDQYGNVYIGSHDKNLYAISGQNGSALWTVGVNASISKTGALAAAAHVVTVVTDSGEVASFSLKTGALLWTMGGTTSQSIPVISDTSQLLVVTGRVVNALDGLTGAAIWQTTIYESQIPSGTASASYDGTNILCTEEWCQYSCEAKLASVSDGGATNTIAGTPNLGGGRVTVMDATEGVAYLASTTQVCAFLAGGWCTNVATSAPVAIHKPTGMLVATSADSHVYGLNMTSGAIVWSYKTQAPVTASASIGHDGTAYVGSGDSYLYALNVSTGSLKWSFQTSASISSAPAIANGMLYVSSEDFNVYALADAV